MNKLQQIAFNYRMKLAALRQYLRDRSDTMTDSEIDEILDEINKALDNIKFIEDLIKRGLQ
jgi:hypothetical protein